MLPFVPGEPLTARYIIRVDDACPTMDLRRWGKLESIFDRLGIRPLVAVIPDNQDPELKVDVPDDAFWDRVRDWQAKGWAIAMHDYQHRFHFVDRKQLLLPFYDRSEFAGLPLDEQSVKIRASWQIFQKEGVSPTVWIAPAHCFDRTTLTALEAETPIRIVSDGIACDQYQEDGFFWLPQQLWAFTEKSSGLWTICLHPNSMTDRTIEELVNLLASDAILPRVVGVNDLVMRPRHRSVKDNIYAAWFWRRDGFYKLAGKVRRLLPFAHRRGSGKTL